MASKTSDHYLDRSGGIETVRRWWTDLSSDTGGRAELRRCRSPQDVMLHPQYHRLRTLLREAGVGLAGKDEILAVVAGLLAHVKDDQPQPDDPRAFARAMAKSAGEDSGRPKISGLRFRRLIAEDDLGRLYTQLRRVIHQLGGFGPVHSLLVAVDRWNRRTPRIDVRRDWCEAYYTTNPTAI